jgi:hypothetical protein
MTSVFAMVNVFQLICEVLHIISNFEPIKQMLLLNSILASVFRMVKVFQLICEMLHIISNSQSIKEM